MKQQKPQQRPIPAVFNADAAPTIFFDGVYAQGARDGGTIIQVELGMSHYLPVENPAGVRSRISCVGHLRCSADAARGLVASLNAALRSMDLSKDKAN